MLPCTTLNAVSEEEKIQTKVTIIISSWCNDLELATFGLSNVWLLNRWDRCAGGTHSSGQDNLHLPQQLHQWWLCWTSGTCVNLDKSCSVYSGCTAMRAFWQCQWWDVEWEYYADHWPVAGGTGVGLKSESSGQFALTDSAMWISATFHMWCWDLQIFFHK